MKRLNPGCDGGFTLLELLVAMAIFGIIGAFAMGGLNAVLNQQEIARAELERLRQIQRAVRVVSNDFTQLNPRFVRDELGGSEPVAPFIAPCSVSALVCFSRDGWRNPFAQFPRGTLQRVEYRVEDSRLIREYWPVMDHTLGNEKRIEVLLDEVEAFDLSYLARGAQEWQTQWPPLEGATGSAAAVNPEAVRVVIELRDWGEITRIAEILP